MDYIGPRGVSLDEWSQWSDLAQQAALAWQAREQDTCPQGHHRDQWDPEAGGDLMTRVRPRARVCPACEYLHRSQENAGEAYPGEYRVWEALSDHAEDREDDDDAGDEQDQPDDVS